MLCSEHFTSFLLKFKPNLLVKRIFLLNAAFSMTVLDLISRENLAPFVTMLLKQLKYFTFSSCVLFIMSVLGIVALRLSLGFFHIHFHSIASSSSSYPSCVLQHRFFLNQ